MSPNAGHPALGPAHGSTAAGMRGHAWGALRREWIKRASVGADLTMSVKALASLYSGFRSPRQLAQWGFVDADEHALDRATRIFATRHAPHCPDNF